MPLISAGRSSSSSPSRGLGRDSPEGHPAATGVSDEAQALPWPPKGVLAGAGGASNQISRVVAPLPTPAAEAAGFHQAAGPPASLPSDPLLPPLQQAAVFLAASPWLLAAV